MLRDLILKNRSTRKYHQNAHITLEMLKEFIDLARLSGSAGNRQPLRYILSCEPEKNAVIFHNISLAGEPKEGERPSAFIVILGDKEIRPNFGFDPGIAAQSILLGATEKGLGGCMIGMINRPELLKALNLPDHYEILLVIAIGKPSETFTIETVGHGGETQGWSYPQTTTGRYNHRLVRLLTFIKPFMLLTICE
jgi:nitroreductase